MKIAIVGAYGVFGKHICDLLARNIPQATLIFAGRSSSKLNKFFDYFQSKHPGFKASVALFEMNFSEQAFLEEHKPAILINAIGPFKPNQYTLAQYCIVYGVHYIDLADNRDYVTHIRELDQQSQHNNVLVVSGASTVPGLSCAVIDCLLSQFSVIEEVDYGISPGNKTERGLGTLISILSYAGAPFLTWHKGLWKKIYGWQNLHRESYPEIGMRWMSNCNIPDLTLFKDRYPSLVTIRFYAGLELGLLHVGLWVISWMRRLYLIGGIENFGSVLLRISLWFYRFGSDQGGMHVKIRGRDEDGKMLQRKWYILAKDGHGPFIPAAASVLIAKKLLDNTLKQRGATPCIGLFTLDEFLVILKPFSIKTMIIA